MEETLRELAGDLQMIHQSLERAEAVERQLGRYWRELEDQLRAATDRAEAAEGRAAGLYRALCETVKASGGIATEGLSDEFLILGVPAEMAARKKAQEAAEAAEAHAADLRGALEQVDKLAVAHSPQMAGKVSLRMMHAGMSEALHGVKVALARTPAKSLARVKAEALREAIEEARNDEAAQESAATTRGALLCIADRLEEEAANDPH